MRLASAVGAVSMLLTGLGAAAPAHAAPCWSDQLTALTEPIAATGARETIQMGSLCPTAAVTLQRIDGTLRQKVRLTAVNDTADGYGTYGSFTAPVKNGAGTWKITHLHDGSATRTLAKPYTFVVKRATTFPMRAESWTTAGTPHTITGKALYYTSAGTAVPHRNTPIEVMGMARDGSPLPHRLGSTRTDSAGVFRFTSRYPENYELTFETRPANAVIDRGELIHVVLLQPGVYRTGHQSQVALGVPTTITGYAGPGKRTVGLSWDDLDNGGGFVDTGARATTDVNGNFRLHYTPGKLGKHHFLLVTPPGAPWVNEPYVNPDFSMAVGKPSVRLDGVADPTKDPVVRPGTKMSSYGHLRLADPNGNTAPSAGQTVLVQTRPRGATAYGTVATATTTSTGYYYANWNASADADVRVANLSSMTFTYIRYLDVH